MENKKEQVILKVETKDKKIKIVYEKGVFSAVQDGKVVYESDDYEVTRFVVLGF
jgi:hypothetical protein